MPKYSNIELAHLWANGSTKCLESNHGGMFSSGAKLYSYGSHYLLGYRMPDNRALINTRQYSVTTSKHQSFAWRAARHLSPIGVADLTALESLLDSLARNMRDNGKVNEGTRGEVRTFLERNACEVSAELGDYLAGLARLSWQSILAAATRRKAKADAAGLRALERQARGFAAEYAGMSPRDFAARVTRARATPDGYVARRQLKDLADTLYTAHREGTKRQTAADKRRRAILWSRLKEVRAILARPDAGAMSRRRFEFAADAATLRAAINPALDIDSATSSRRFRLIRQTAAKLAAHPRVPGAATVSLIALASLAGDAQTAAELRENAERMAKEAAARAEWLAGEGHSYSRLSDERGGALLRAVDVERDAAGEIVDGTLETSHGARVPLCHAIRAFRFLKLCRDTGREWQANGRTIRVGHYRIDRVERSGDFVAGCHNINWNEVQRIALELGVFALEPSESALEPSTAAA